MEEEPQTPQLLKKKKTTPTFGVHRNQSGSIKKIAPPGRVPKAKTSAHHAKVSTAGTENEEGNLIVHACLSTAYDVT